MTLIALTFWCAIHDMQKATLVIYLYCLSLLLSYLALPSLLSPAPLPSWLCNVGCQRQLCRIDQSLLIAAAELNSRADCTDCCELYDSAEQKSVLKS